MKLRKKWLLSLLCVLLLLPALPAAAAGTQSPYYITVNRLDNTVTVYTADENGEYTVPYRAMICSVGRAGHYTPLGTFQITGLKKEWGYMFDGSFARYTSQFNKNILFHSVCYSAMRRDALLTEEYNALGSVASLGCVRLQTADAKWIYDNCPAGTKVTVFESEQPGPLGRPERAVACITEGLPCGWDPTDPDPENPWADILLPFRDLSYGAWYYESAEAVYKAGLMNGTAADRFSPGGEVTLAMVLTILARLDGQETDGGAEWYSRGVQWAQEREIYDGVSSLGPLSREKMAEVLWRCAGCPEPESLQPDFADAADIDPALLPAVCWAAETGLLNGVGGGLLAPTGGTTRAQLAVLTVRFEALREEN